MAGRRTTFGELVEWCYDPLLPEPQAGIAAWLVRVYAMGLVAVA